MISDLTESVNLEQLGTQDWSGCRKQLTNGEEDVFRPEVGLESYAALSLVDSDQLWSRLNTHTHFR